MTEAVGSSTARIESAAVSRWHRRVRKAAAALLGAVVLGGGIIAAYLQAREDWTATLRWSPRRLLSPAMQQQVNLVKRALPAGAALFYLNELKNSGEALEFGMWQRSLFPDHMIFALHSVQELGDPKVQALRTQYQISYVLSVGDLPPDPAFGSKKILTLADSPGAWTVLGAFNTEDLAAKKQAEQSSTFPAANPTDASRAVDGNPDGNAAHGSLTHTGRETYPWWQTDLGVSTFVGSIVVWNRTDCCAERLGDYWIFVSETPFASKDTPATLLTRAGTWSSHQRTPPNPSTTVWAGVQGRYIRVQLSGANYLSLAEVEVY